MNLTQFENLMLKGGNDYETLKRIIKTDIGPKAFTPPLLEGFMDAFLEIGVVEIGFVREESDQNTPWLVSVVELSWSYANSERSSLRRVCAFKVKDYIKGIDSDYEFPCVLNGFVGECPFGPFEEMNPATLSHLTVGYCSLLRDLFQAIKALPATSKA